MKKALAVMLCLSMVLTTMVLPEPAKALRYGSDRDLSNVDGSFIGPGQNVQAGYPLNHVGDINGDGFDDIVILSEYQNSGAYIFFGKATGWKMDTSLAKADVYFASIDYEVIHPVASGVGDVNGDGYDDMMFENTIYGRYYLILGKLTGWEKNPITLKSSASFNAEPNFVSQFGRIGKAGDVNGDGLGDIIIASPYYGITGLDTRGRVYVVFGRPSGWGWNVSLTQSNASYDGEISSSQAGLSVADGIGDINRDGYDDIAIYGYTTGSCLGQVYLIFGRSLGWSKNVSLSNSNASFCDGGYAAGVGDVNGDHIDDILVESWSKSYLIFGKVLGWTMQINLTTSSNASFDPEPTVGSAPSNFAGAGDVNGDRFNDFLLSDVMNNEKGLYSGETYLFLGHASGWSMNISISTADMSFRGEAKDDFSGNTICGDVDVNGDGLDDLLIGAPYNDENGDTSGQTYLIFPEINLLPTSINSIKAYSDGTYLKEIDSVFLGDKVHLELRGTDGNATHQDGLLVRALSDTSSPLGINIELIETGKNTGIYRGNFTVKDSMDKQNRWLQASNDDTLKVFVLQEPSKNTTLYVGSISMNPSSDNLFVTEDQAYEEHYWTKGYSSAEWSLETNASWLSWNATAHNISGIPDNGDVGKFHVKINVTDTRGGSEEHNFILMVNNTPPIIDTIALKGAIEDQPYLVDYNSSDDGQGKITWHLGTNATWLSMNDTTGVLKGTPANGDVGQYHVNVSVYDGNGGWDWSNYTLKVANTNDKPTITSSDNLTAYEDSEYSVQYSATDIDVGDSLTWHFATNASTWLYFDELTDLLSGTPTNDDVGWYWVNVSVTDLTLATDHHNFTLSVDNTNDLPVILSTEVSTATEDSAYSVQYVAQDIDKGDLLTWHLTTSASNWLTIGPGTGLLSGTPSNDDVGSLWVNVSVSDRAGAEAFQNFTQTVLNTNDIPVITSSPATNAGTARLYQYDVNATDVDVGDVLTFTLDIKPSGMAINSITGLISWTPTEAQVGNQTVKVSVSDGMASINQTFEVLVVRFNHKPVITALADATVKVGQILKQTVSATDADAGDTLTYKLEGQPIGLVISSTGVITWKPTKDQIGVHSVIIKVSDGKAESVIQFVITVVKKPPTSDGMGWKLPAIIGIVMVVCIVAAVVVVLQRREKK